MANISNATGHEGSFGEFPENEHTHPPIFQTSITSDSTENLLIPSTVAVYSQELLVKTFPGHYLVILYIIFIVTFEVMAFILCNVLHVKLLGGVDEPFAFLTVLHVGVWMFTFVCDRYLHFHHHKLRRAGYLMFYMKTKEVRRVPLMIFSLGNAALLLVVSFSPSSAIETNDLVHIFQWTLSGEVLVSLISLIIYLGYIIKFNRAKQMPDVYHEDVVSGFHDQMYSTEVGFRDEVSSGDILERQSEMIRYLRQHNMNLGKRIVEISQLLSHREQQAVLNESNLPPQLHPPS